MQCGTGDRNGPQENPLDIPQRHQDPEESPAAFAAAVDYPSPFIRAILRASRSAFSAWNFASARFSLVT